MRHAMTTKNDLRNWVDAATANWDGRTDDDVNSLVDNILRLDGCPNWGQDWSEFLRQVPELTSLLAGGEVTC